MSDFDTRRIGEIAALEQRLQAALEGQRELKSLSKWEPIFNVEVNETTTKFSLAIADKAIGVTYPTENVVQLDTTTLTTVVLNTLFEHLLADVLRPLLLPKVQQAIELGQATRRAGKW